MPNLKISQFAALAAPAFTDYLPIVDISEPAAADRNKRITVGVLATEAIGLRSYENTLIVDEGGRGDYVTISGAMAGIIAPAADNRWQVLVFGHIEEATPVLVPSYTTIEGVGDASVALADLADCHLFVNADQVGGNAGICIRNLHIDGNRAGQTPSMAANVSHSIYMVLVTGLTLENVHVRETYDQAFKLLDCVDLWVNNCGCDGIGTDGWSLDNCSYAQMSNVYGRNVDGLDGNGNARPGGVSAFAFEIENGTHHLEMSNVRCENCSSLPGGGGLHVSAHALVYCSYITIHGLIATNITGGFCVAFAGLDGPLSVDGLQIAGSGTGLQVSTPSIVSVSNFHIAVTGAAIAIYLYDEVQHLALSNGYASSESRCMYSNVGGTLGDVDLSNVYLTCSGSNHTLNITEECNLTVTGGSIVDTGTGDATNFAAKAYAARFDGVRLQSALHYPIYLASGATGIEFHNCYITSLRDAATSVVLLDGNNTGVRFVGGRIATGHVDQVYALQIDAGCQAEVIGVELDLTTSGVLRSAINGLLLGCIVQGCHFIAGNYGIYDVAAGAVVTGNYFSGQNTAPIRGAGIVAGSIIRGNSGYVTENNGTATVPNLATSIAVNHGLGRTPALDDISVTPTNDLGLATKFWISNPGAAQFTINVDADPGVGTATFAWSAAVL